MFLNHQNINNRFVWVPLVINVSFLLRNIVSCNWLQKPITIWWILAQPYLITHHQSCIPPWQLDYIWIMDTSMQLIKYYLRFVSILIYETPFLSIISSNKVSVSVNKLMNFNYSESICCCDKWGYNQTIQHMSID